MRIARSFAATTAAIGAAAALAAGAAGTANAATVKHQVEGNTVSATFSTLKADVCVATLTERGDSNRIVDILKNTVNLKNIGNTLTGENVILLKSDRTGLPFAATVIGVPSTVSASNVPDGNYSLVTYCAGDTVPVTNFVNVGNAATPTGSLVLNGNGQAMLSTAVNFF